MLGKLNDKYHIIFFTNTKFNVVVLCNHFCVTVCFTSPNATRKERDIITLKPLDHSEQYCAGGKIKKNEISRVCGANGGGERCAQGYWW
jgi:hypothetical protein